MVFLSFEVVYGLHINHTKSVFCPVNEVINLQEIADTLGCEVGSFPVKYLDLPLGIKSKATTISLQSGMAYWWSVKGSYQSWKREHLSLGGGQVLINSVLDSLPTYTPILPLPASTENRRDKLQRDFLWQGNRQNKFFKTGYGFYWQEGQGHGDQISEGS